MIHPFNGTIFRLPLRTKKQSHKSQLSSKYYTNDDIELMYNSLIHEGDNFLIFLKSINSLEYYKWSDINTKQPTLLYRVNIADKLSKKQFELRNYITKIQKPDANISWLECNDFKFETCIFNNNNNNNKKYYSQWIICNALGGGSKQAAQIASNPENKNLKLLPYGGIAARISTNVPWQINNNENDEKQQDNIPKLKKQKSKNAIIRPKGSLIGRAYCFLSLPLKNGLPVHCNGYFELSSNRRDLWWGSADDMTGNGSLRYFWNMCLLQDVICRAYVQVINYAKGLYIKNKITIDTFYNLWPYQIPGNEGDPFEILTQEVLNVISNQYQFLYSKQNGGKWLKCSQSVISSSNENKFMNTLLKIGLPIVEMPGYQLNVLQKAPRPPTNLSATYVRDWLRQKITSNNKILIIINGLNSNDQILLIEYLFNDLKALSTQQLMIKSDFPECLHMMPIFPVFEHQNSTNKLRLFWCNDEMEKDIAEQIFGTKEYTQPIYYSDDKLCFKILSQTKKNKICP
eukprot:179640_1